MPYRADLSHDIPQEWKPKRIIFYAQGLKIYGLLPHLLNRRIKGEFISNYWVHSSGVFRGAGMIAPTGEANYTIVPYTQKPEHAQVLLDWLFEDAGFEWAIASEQNWNDDIRAGNVGQQPPQVWTPASPEQEYREGFRRAIEGDRIAIAILGGMP